MSLGYCRANPWLTACFRYKQKALSKIERAVGGIRNESACSSGDSYWLLIAFVAIFGLFAALKGRGYGVILFYFVPSFCEAWSHGVD